jgi:hypothetical protein
LFIVGCGKSSGGGSSTGTVGAGVCAAGLVNTQYGCLSQGNCPVGQAQYNNGQCVAATANQCAAGSTYSSQVSTCLPQGNCPVGQGLYNGQCIIADGYNSNNGWNNNGGWNNSNWNNGGFTPGINGGFNASFYYQVPAYNPYIPQQNYNTYWNNPFYNPCWTPQYYYGW